MFPKKSTYGTPASNLPLRILYLHKKFFKVILIVLISELLCGACSVNLNQSGGGGGKPNYVQFVRNRSTSTSPFLWGDVRPNPKQSLSTISFLPKQFKTIINIGKFIIVNLFGHQWTAEGATKRLDKLKTTLIEYYAKEDLFSFSGTARDKGIGFPSLEGALLSLAFLTFSVMLIDLIQMLLARLRMPAGAAPAQAAAAMGRSYNLRDGENDDNMLSTLSSKVLSAIEKPYLERM